jgi:hypothetical protein
MLQTPSLSSTTFKIHASMAGKKAKAKARKVASQPVQEVEFSRTYSKSAVTSLHAELCPETFEHFEFREAPGKGIGAFATKPIRSGTVLFYEKPLFTVHDPEGDLAELEIQAAYAKLSHADKKKFNALRDPEMEAGKNPFGLKYYKFSANAFQSGDGASDCVAIGSRFNHACQPNATCPIYRDGHVFKTLVDIEQDEEITFCYMEQLNYMTTDERRPQLQDRLSQPCKCTLCLLPPSERLVSDMRRFLMRWLLYKIEGKDFKYATPKIKGLRRYGVGAYDEITLYALLVVRLAEAEGVMTGNTPQFMFTVAAKFLLMQYYSKGLKRIPQTARINARTWLRTSEDLIKRSTEDVLRERDVDWADTRRMLDRIGPNGELPPLDQFKEFRPRIRGLDY